MNERWPSQHALGVIVSSRVAGDLPGSDPSISLDLASEVDLASGVLESFAEAGLPAAGVSFGSNDPSTAVAPMDWGLLIPLWFMGGRNDPPLPLVVVTPARELPASAHVAAGTAIAQAAELVRTDSLHRLAEIPAEMVEDAKGTAGGC
jgi:aromatic ring-opening dioxygenase LigB subunit